MPLSHPFQKICIVPPRVEGEQILLAASGSTIRSLCLRSGKLLATWPSINDESASEDEAVDQSESHDHTRPSKRVKLDADDRTSLVRQASEQSDDSVEIVAERKKGERRRPKTQTMEDSSVSHVVTTKDGKSAVVVTTEDKSVKVFQITSSGRLKILSERSLPKRLCAVQLTRNEDFILAADKFGDVYAIPLFPSADWIPKPSLTTSRSQFIPSATELTVHTKGNLEALRQQQTQQHFKQRKEGPNFEHELLLGHVSLLTDLIVAVGTVDNQSRPYILTADRDEHIRVSRGIPQAHIIESYCLGHEEFVSRLSVVPWAPHILLAGNGKPSLRSFRWQTGEPLQTHSLGQDLAAMSSFSLAKDRSPERLAVSGIWPFTIEHDAALAEALQTKGVILVALEGLPLVQTYYLDLNDHLHYLTACQLPGNVLDLAQVGSSSTMVVSLDTMHEAQSMHKFAPGGAAAREALMSFEFHLDWEKETQETTTNGSAHYACKWTEVPLALKNTASLQCSLEVPVSESAIHARSKSHNRAYSVIGEFLYGLENLRKKRGLAAEQETVEHDEEEGNDVSR